MRESRTENPMRRTKCKKSLNLLHNSNGFIDSRAAELYFSLLHKIADVISTYREEERLYREMKKSQQMSECAGESVRRDIKLFSFFSFVFGAFSANR